MKKRINIAVIKSLFVVLLSPYSVLADTSTREDPKFPCHTLKLKDGYYVGIAAGYDVYKMKDKIYFHEDDTLPEITMDSDLALNGMIGNFFFGYGRQFGSKEVFYLGVEGYANGSAADNDFQLAIPDMVIIDSDLIVNGSYGLDIIPGIMINPTTMLYFKLGYNWSTVNIDETVRVLFNSVEYTDSVTMDGVMYGIGLESAFYDHFTMRADYSHTDYHSFKTRSGAMVQSARNEFMLGLVYHF